MNNKLFLNDDIRLKGKFKILDDTEAIIDCSTGVSSGALTVAGGVAVGKNLHVCGTDNIASISGGGGTPSGFFNGGVHVGKDLYVGDDLFVDDQLQVNDRVLVENHIRIGGSAASSQLIEGIQPLLMLLHLVVRVFLLDLHQKRLPKHISAE